MFQIRSDPPQKFVHACMTMALGYKIVRDGNGNWFALEKGEEIPSGMESLNREEIKLAEVVFKENSIQLSSRDFL